MSDESPRRICSSMRERCSARGVYRIGDGEFCMTNLPLEYGEFDRMTRSPDDCTSPGAGLPTSVGACLERALRTRPCC